MTVKLYDTTLRDGAQQEGISLSVDDKLNITRRLDDLGMHYIEGGIPGSNPKDIEYFKRVRKLPLSNSLISAFGLTRRANSDVESDLFTFSIAALGLGVSVVKSKLTFSAFSCIERPLSSVSGFSSPDLSSSNPD